MRCARTDEGTAVKFTGCYLLSDFPGEAILKAAREHDCDGIVTSSHGGSVRRLLGSETRHVLAVAKVPVMVIQ